MVYKVKLTAPAEADAYAAYEYIRAPSPRSAEKWLKELFQAIFTLDEMPARCPIISEAAEIGQPLRQLLYGKRSGIYRIIAFLSLTWPDPNKLIWRDIRASSRLESLLNSETAIGSLQLLFIVRCGRFA